MSYRGRPSPKRLVRTPRISSKKYKISAEPPMHASAFQTTALPGKLQAAKLTYDLAVEEAAQKKIVREITVLDREIMNERARYQNRNRGVVRSESQLLTGSRTYTMLKRQKEQLQREQQSSLERLTNLTSKQLISANPVETATKAFKGISKKNPMRRGRKYVPVVPASAGKSPLEGLGSSIKGVFGTLAQPLIPQAEAAFPLGTLPTAIRTGAKAFTTAQTKGAGKMVQKAIQNERMTAMANATKFDVEQKIAELKVKHPDNPKMWTEKAARIEIGNDAANKTKQMIGEERSGSLFPGVPTPKVAFTKEVTTSDAPAPLGALLEREATEKFAKLGGRKVLPGRKGAGQFYSKDLVDLKKMAAVGTGVGIAGAAPIQAAYGDVYQATPETQTIPTVDPSSPLGQAYEASAKPSVPKASVVPSPTFESRLAEVEARGAGGIAEGTLYKEGFFEDFALGASDIVRDYADIPAAFTADTEGAELTSLSSRSSVFHLMDSSVEQGWAYAFEPEKFATWEKQGGHPLDMAINIASKKSIMRLAGEVSVEAGIAAGTMGFGRLGIGAIQGARLASKGILVGSKRAALTSTKQGKMVTKYVQPVKEGGKAGYKKTKGGKIKTSGAITEAKRIQAGGRWTGIWGGVKQAGAITARDPFGFGEIRHVLPLLGKITGKNVKPLISKLSPAYELPKMKGVGDSRFAFLASKGSIAARQYEMSPAKSITKSRGIKGIPRMDIDSIAPLYLKPKPRKPAHLKKYPKTTKTKQTKNKKKQQTRRKMFAGEPPEQKRVLAQMGDIYATDLKKAGEFVFWKHPVIGVVGGSAAAVYGYGHATGQIGRKPGKGK